MDKYQKFLVQKARIKEWLYFENNDVSDEESNKYWKRVVFDEENDTITIAQDENPNIVDYILIVFGEKFIKSIETYKNSKWENVEEGKFKTRWPAFRLNINFDDRIEKVKVSFRDNLADDYVINVIYQEADKDKYNAKLARERKEELLKIANIKVSTGADLVNIYFQPCCDDYVHTEITLYKDNMMLAKYKVDEETFFKSINGLAYGKYEFILKQFDKDNNVILETDKISFSLVKPNYGGKPTIII